MTTVAQWHGGGMHSSLLAELSHCRTTDNCTDKDDAKNAILPLPAGARMIMIVSEYWLPQQLWRELVEYVCSVLNPCGAARSVSMSVCASRRRSKVFCRSDETACANDNEKPGGGGLPALTALSGEAITIVLVSLVLAEPC